MGSGRALATWGKRGRFSYTGDLARGTKIRYGRGSSFLVTAEHYDELLRLFAGRTVAIGLSLRPPRESLGSFLAARLGRQGLAAYVGPILVREGVAERVGETELRFT